jgi:hypothetical protein
MLRVTGILLLVLTITTSFASTYPCVAGSYTQVLVLRRGGEQNESRLDLMEQVIPNLLNRDARVFPATVEVIPASEELQNLLIQRIKLSNDIARIREFLRRGSQNGRWDSRGTNSTEDLIQTQTARPSETPLDPIRRSGFRRSRARGASGRPRRWELERACRIALMEADEPSPVERVYDRIQRRGALSFTGYRRPFRAITLAMNSLVRKGEASLLDSAGSRSWRWEPKRGSFETPDSFTWA